MLKILQKVFDILTAVTAAYALISQKYEITSYLTFFQGVMLLVLGLVEMKEERKKSGFFLVVSSLFIFYVAAFTVLN